MLKKFHMLGSELTCGPEFESVHRYGILIPNLMDNRFLNRVSLYTQEQTVKISSKYFNMMLNSKMRIFLCLLLCWASSLVLCEWKGQYPVPNPFLDTPLYKLSVTEKWFSRKSMSNFSKQVLEVFDLHTGNFYSHIDLKTESGSEGIYAITRQNSRDMAFIVNIEKYPSEPIRCSDDRQHWNSRQSPWYAEVALPNRNVKTKVYGVTGIWWTAINMNLKSIPHAGFEDPDFEGMNIWFGEHDNYQIELGFNKPDETNIKSEDEMAKAVSKTLLQVGRVRLYSESARKRGPVVIEQKFKVDYQGNNKVIEDLKNLLLNIERTCGYNSHEVQKIPSLKTILDKSSRSYMLEYSLVRFNDMSPGLNSGKYDEKEHRRVYNEELHQEFFDIKKANQIKLIKSLASSDKFDKFWKFYMNATYRYDSETGRATEYYHESSERENCKRNEAEGVDKLSILRRRYDFDDYHSGVLNGLGALYMNLEDFDHSKASLMKEIIKIPKQYGRTDDKEIIQCRKWTFDSYSTDGKPIEVQLYFKWSSHQTISDLKVVKILYLNEPPVIKSESDRLLLIYYMRDIQTYISDRIIPTLNKNCISQPQPRIDDIPDDPDPYPYPYDPDSFEPPSPDEPTDFEPSEEEEKFYFPSFHSYSLDSEGYKFESRLSISGGDPSKYLEIQDVHWRSSGLTKVSINDKKQMVSYILDNDSEFMFVLNKDENDCDPESGQNMMNSSLRLLSAKLLYQSRHGLNHYWSDKLRSVGVAALWILASDSYDLRYIGKVEEQSHDNHKFEIYQWKLINGNEYDDIVLSFQFRFDVTMLEEYRAQIKRRDPSLKRKVKEDFYSLHSISSSSSNKFPSFQLDIDDTVFMKKDEKPDLKQCDRKIEDSRLEVNKMINHISFVPSIEQFISPVDNYHALYELRYEWWAPKWDYDERTSNEKLQLVNASRMVREKYDRKLGIGKIEMFELEDQPVIGPLPDPKRTLYINDAEKTLLYYRHDTNLCRSVENSGFFSGPLSSYLENVKSSLKYGDQFEAIFGLIALWKKMSQTKLDFVESRKTINSDGEEVWLDHYMIYIEPSSPNQVDEGSTLEATFQRNVDSGHLELKTIDINGYQVERRASIKLLLLDNESGNEVHFVLPNACDNPLEPGESPDDPKFIRIQDKFTNPNELIHMRSKVFTTHETIGGQKMLIMDEFYHGGKYRLSSSGQGLDVIIDEPSQLPIDISQPHRCFFRVPKLFEESTTDNTNQFVNFWTGFMNTKVERPLDLYYAPMALWWLASQDNQILHFEPDTVSKPDANSLDRFLTWTLNSPQHVSVSWKITFIFVRERDTSDSPIILNTIDLQDHNIHSGFQWHVNVLHYHDHCDLDYETDHDHDHEHDHSKIFQAPVGAGCIRDPDQPESSYHGQVDELDLPVRRRITFDYQATLETRLATEQPKIMSPVTGTFMTSGFDESRLDLHLDVWSSVTRNRKGNLMKKNHLVDYFNRITYTVDRGAGECSIGSGTYLWMLEFHSQQDDSSIKIQMEPHLYQTFFGSTIDQKFNLIQEQNTEGSHVITYEKTLDSFSLQILGSKPIEGPASVIRTFTRRLYPRGKLEVSNDIVRNYNSQVLVELLIFNIDRSQLRTRLKIHLGPIVHVNRISELLDFAQVESCWNQPGTTSYRRTRSIELRYRALSESREPFNAPHWIHISNELIRKLTSITVGMLPSQLVESSEQPNVSGDLLTFTFDIVDPPTAMDHFVLEMNAKFQQELELIGPFKLTPHISECSRWCDQMNCIAMSHCLDTMICRVVTLEMLMNISTGDSEVDVRRALSKRYKRDNQCSFFYLDHNSRRSLSVDSLLDKLKQIIANRTGELDLSESDIHTNLEAIDVVETSSSFYDKDTSIEDPDFNVIKFERTLVKHGDLGDGISVEYLNTDTIRDCLIPCQSSNCLVVSYCNDAKTCIRYKGNTIDLHTLVSSESKAIKVDKDCTLMARNFLAGYTIFQHYKTPDKLIKAQKIVGYTDLECASVCGSSKSDGSDNLKCLSFDLCLNGTEETCYLHESHILLPNEQHPPDEILSTDNPPMKCTHYSKSLLADFKLITRQSLKNQALVTEAHSVRSDQQCALDCILDDDCWAFEFCFDGVSLMCRLVLPGNLNISLKEWTQQLDYEPSTSCSVYLLEHPLVKYDNVLPNADTDEFDKLDHWTLRFLSGLGFMILGISIGIVAQVIFMIRNHRAIRFDRWRMRC